ncbi:hypothetical protein Bbelb_049930 [Branchiostoma belcheri]|nr:hypothetical protein Bbelb_049930 [Branchiostoma belcheri]
MACGGCPVTLAELCWSVPTLTALIDDQIARYTRTTGYKAIHVTSVSDIRELTDRSSAFILQTTPPLDRTKEQAKHGTSVPLSAPGVLQSAQKRNEDHMKRLEQIKTKTAKDRRIALKVARAHQEERKAWNKRRPVRHTYGEEDGGAEDSDSDDKEIKSSPLVAWLARHHTQALGSLFNYQAKHMHRKPGGRPGPSHVKPKSATQQVADIALLMKVVMLPVSHQRRELPGDITDWPHEYVRFYPGVSPVQSIKKEPNTQEWSFGKRYGKGANAGKDTLEAPKLTAFANFKKFYKDKQDVYCLALIEDPEPEVTTEGLPDLTYHPPGCDSEGESSPIDLDKEGEDVEDNLNDEEGDNQQAVIERRQRQRRLLYLGLAVAQDMHAATIVDRAIWEWNRSKNWRDETVVGTFTDADWQETFRVSRLTFDYLCDKLRARLQRRRNMKRRIPAPVEKRVAVALWYLATGCGYRKLGHLFGVCRAIVHELKKQYIRIPKGQHLREVVETFEDKWQFPQYLQNHEARSREVMADLGLSVTQTMMQVFTDYVERELTDLVFQPIGLIGLKPPHHLVFAGPPGTGKTTMGDAFAKLLHQFGIVTSPDLVTIRRDLLSSGVIIPCNSEDRRLHNVDCITRCGDGYGRMKVKTAEGNERVVSPHRVMFLTSDLPSLTTSMHVSHLCNHKHLSYEERVFNQQRRTVSLKDGAPATTQDIPTVL